GNGAGFCWGEWGRVMGSSGLWWNGAGSGEMEVTCVAGKLGMNSAFKSFGQEKLTNDGFHFNKILIYYDSKSTIAISCNPVQHSRTKHSVVRYHFKKEHVEKGTIELYFLKTDYQLADIFTKALPADRFNYLVCRLGMRSLSPKELERLAKSQ
nr:retrovirus-related Pol polyprotein from transposon TNT 1-94 [Tanacetum cinerariifolium]